MNLSLTRRMKMALTALLASTLMAACGLRSTNSSTETLTIYQDAPKMKLLDLGEPGNSPGDVYHFFAPLHSSPGGPVIGEVFGDGVRRDVDRRHLCVAYDVLIDLATAATRVNKFRVRGKRSSYEVIESGLYQVVSIETGDGVIGGPFDVPPLAIPVLIPHVAHGGGIGVFLFCLSPG